MNPYKNINKNIFHYNNCATTLVLRAQFKISREEKLIEYSTNSKFRSIVKGNEEWIKFKA
jgi:hypothetical protein